MIFRLLKQIVYWTIFVSAINWIIGILLHLIRFGAVLESSPWTGF